MYIALLYLNTIILILVLALLLSFFVKIFVFKDFDEMINTQATKLQSAHKDSMIKFENFNSYFLDISESIENKVNQINNYLNRAPLKTDQNKPILLNDFSILYFTPYEGYLSIEAEYCELNLPDDSQICIKNKLNNFYINANKPISIKNIKSIKNIYFIRKE